MAARTNKDWSNKSFTSRSGGTVASTLGRIARMFLTMSIVDAPPFFSTVRSTPRAPSWRPNQILRAKGIHHIHRGKLLGLQRRSVDIYLYLPLLASIRIGNGRALNRNELGPDEIHGGVEQPLFGKGVAAESELQNRHTGR